MAASSLESGRVNVAVALDTAPLGGVQKSIFALCFLAMLIDGFDNHILAYAAPLVLRDLGLPPASLGGLISIALVGMMISGFLGGLLADQIGRRSVILMGMTVFTGATVGKGMSGSYSMLLAMQGVAGIGLGAVFINVLALGAEYAPAKQRRFFVTCISAAYPLGGISASFATAAIAPTHGWRWVFLLGGAMSFIILCACARWLLPSVRQLTLAGKSSEKIDQIMRRIGDFPAGTLYTTSEKQAERVPVGQLFEQGRGLTTCLLAVAVAASLLSGYFVTSWSSTILTLSGMPPALAMLASSMLPAGAVIGSLIWGRLSDRFWPPAVLGSAALLGTLCYAFIGHLTGAYPLLFAVTALGGLAMGMQNAYNGFITSIYPTAARGTALGTIIGFGRIASIAGPLLGGILVSAEWDARDLYYVPAGFMAIALACMILSTVLPAARRFIAQGEG